MQMEVVYLGVALVSLCAVLLSSRRRRRSAMNELPGPWQLPVIGSLHHLVGQLPHRAMRDLARRYGPVLLLRLGEVPTLVVSSREGAREVTKTHDLAFATRPLSATARVLTNGGRDIVFAPYGDHWRQVKKIAVFELLSARRVTSFRAVREEEVAAVLRDVAEAAVATRPVELRACLSALGIDITVRAIMGDRFKERDVFLHALDRSTKLVAGFNPPDLWPSSRLAGYLSGAVRSAKECRDIGNGILDAIIKERLERTMEGGGGQKNEDLLDVLLSMHKEGKLDMDAVKYVIFDLFSAGSETTTLEWAFAELMRNPKVMHKATAEVRRAFRAQGTVAEHRLNELPYMHLVIREALRLHMPTPLLLPRECREPCQVLGYDVPQGTQLLVNVWALGRDKRYWPDGPEEFRPERFEDEDAVDFKGNDFSFLPFGAGRRMCPGMAFGLANIELALASLLFHFDWEGPSPDELDMAEAFGVTARRKADLLLRPVLRVPVPFL
uniref:Cytochrome P450 71D7 n=1 Tax=Aegilops tauschii subsp. strangulata TaxID=200361 RepID=A0A453IFE3_AEGTS